MLEHVEHLVSGSWPVDCSLTMALLEIAPASPRNLVMRGWGDLAVSKVRTMREE